MPSCAPRPFLPYHTHARTEPLRALARAAILFPFLFMEEALSQSLKTNAKTSAAGISLRRAASLPLLQSTRTRALSRVTRQGKGPSLRQTGGHHERIHREVESGSSGVPRPPGIRDRRAALGGRHRLAREYRVCLAIEISTLWPDWSRHFGSGCRPAFIVVPASASRPFACSHLQIPPGDRGARCDRWPRRPASRLRGSFPTC